MASTGENLAAQGKPSRRQLANAIRALAMDAVERARSGHPGMPMGMADIAEVLWSDFLRFNPANPHWYERDRFVLSNGHGSMLLYAIAYLTGYDLDMKELKRFRQLGSRTAGHPERDLAMGIETTTGPLGQGLANAVGMALAEKILAATFNQADEKIVDHYTYVFIGDGCLMEGISHEACSLAGTLRLGKLIALYDDNGVSIDGNVDGWFRDDTPARFRAYGWHVVGDVDGHDPRQIVTAIESARLETVRPSLICCKTVIGYGAPHKQGSAAVHGEALGGAEVEAAREALGWPYPPFEVPDDIKVAWNARRRGGLLEADWQARFDRYRRKYPALAGEYTRRMEGEAPAGWREHARKAIEAIAREGKTMATRKASLRALDAFAEVLPELIGGSADLTGSNNTLHAKSKPVTAEDASGNYVHFGVREFAMCAIANGLSLHGGFLPYVGTFLVFSDYARNALRMAALMRVPAVFVFTHDSIGLGEDGPTHQPIEQLAGLRAMPNMSVWRPCDAVETAVAWRAAIERAGGPTCLVLTRQNLPHLERTDSQIDMIERGGYVLMEPGGAADLVMIATGSEVSIALGAAAKLAETGIQARVVSLPCTDRFDEQSSGYREQVLPPGVPRLAIEAGARDGWWRYVGGDGDVIGMDRFGASAPGETLFEHYGFTAESVAASARRLLTQSTHVET
jgi:transketolase